MIKTFLDYSSFRSTQDTEKQIEEKLHYFNTGLDFFEKFEIACKENSQNFNYLKNEVYNLMTGVKDISKYYSVARRWHFFKIIRKTEEKIEAEKLKLLKAQN